MASKMTEFDWFKYSVSNLNYTIMLFVNTDVSTEYSIYIYTVSAL